MSRSSTNPAEMPELSARWSALVRAVHQELEGGGRRGVQVTHDLAALRISVRRPLAEGREEWIGVTLNVDEVLSRRPEDVAREFARTYYACT